MFYKVDEIVDEKADNYPVLKFNFDKLGDSPDPVLYLDKFSMNAVFPPYYLEKNADLLDVLSGGKPWLSNGLFVSEKFKNCIIDLHLAHVRFFSIDLTREGDGDILNYYYMQIITPKPLIDYNESVFSIFEPGVGVLGEAVVSSQEEFKQKTDQLQRDDYKQLLPKRITLNSEYSGEGLFCLYPYIGLCSMVITESLKQTFEDQGITGIKYDLANEIIG